MLTLIDATFEAVADPLAAPASFSVVMTWTDTDGLKIGAIATSLDLSGAASLAHGLFDEGWGPLDVIGWVATNGYPSGSTAA